MVTLQNALPDMSLRPAQIVEQNRAVLDSLESALGSVPTERWLKDWTVDRHQKWTVNQLRLALQDGDWERATLGYVSAWALVPSCDSRELRSSLDTMRSGLVFANSSQSPILPLKADASNSKHPERPTQAEWRSAVETIIALIDRSDP
jgi:hypothetical protein